MSNLIYKKFINKFNLKRYYAIKEYMCRDWGGSYSDYDRFTIFEDNTYVSQKLYNKYFKIRSRQNLELFKKQYKEALKEERLEIEYQELPREVINNFIVELLKMCKKYLNNITLNSNNNLDIDIMRNILEIKNNNVVLDVQDIFKEWLKIKCY